jgi:arginyl-tRNA synthetase
MLIEYLVDSGWDPANLSPGGAGVGIADLNQLYRDAKKRFDDDDACAKRARQRVVSLQAGDRSTLDAWRYLIEESKRHFNDVYQRLGVKLTDADLRAESFYNPLLSEVASELEKSGVAVMSEGALCVFPPGFTGPEGKPVPVMVRKTDGGYGYDTTDLAGVRYRIKDLHAQRFVYVTDSRQKQHFAMVFKTAEIAGWTKSGVTLEHVPFGTVLGEDGKPFKTRSGETVKLNELLTEAVQRAAGVVTQKNPELSDAMRESIAHAIGVGAIKYADLSTDRIKDYVFSWERMLSFEGNTAPYLINAYVRIRSIFRKAKTQGLESPGFGGAINISDPAERGLALKLLQFPATVESVAQSLEPHRLCTFLYELASSYHQFYERCPVLTAPDAATRGSRLALSDLTARVLRQGLELLGIQTDEQM